MFLKYVSDMFLFCYRSSCFFYNGYVNLFLFLLFLFVYSPAISFGKEYPVKKLMIFGDSLTAGYGLEKTNSFSEKLSRALKSRGRNVKIILSSVSGDTTSGGKARIDWALAEKPDAVLIELGANDGLRGINPKVSQNNLDYIIKKLQKHQVRTLLAGMLAPPNLGREYGDEFNNIYSSLAKKYNILYYPFFLEGVVANPQLNQADGIHPNSIGVDEIIKRMLPMIMKLVR
jgi:acyl-CoA thioesterase-1